METNTTLGQGTIDALHALYATMTGSSSFYAEASKVAKDSAFARLFEALAAQRVTLAAELAVHLKLNQETPAGEGTLKDALHETWMKMRGLINGGDPYVLLLEAECAEDRITANYMRLIKETAGSAMNAVLLEQLATIKTAHDRVRELRELAAKGSA